MKKNLIIILFCNVLCAQQSVKVTYELVKIFPVNYFEGFPEHERSTIKKQLTTPREFTLTSNGTESIYESPESKTVTIASNTPDTQTSKNLGSNIKLPKIWLLKDLTSKKSYDLAILNDVEYYVERDFPNPILNYTNTTRKIEEFDCKMAYFIKKNNPTDTIKYWYTDKIPIIDGPLVCNSTPGLVLMYESKNGVIYATKIEFINDKITIEKRNDKISIISESELANLKERSNKTRTYVDEQGRTHSETTQKYTPK